MFWPGISDGVTFGATVPTHRTNTLVPVPALWQLPFYPSSTMPVCLRLRLKRWAGGGQAIRYLFHLAFLDLTSDKLLDFLSVCSFSLLSNFAYRLIRLGLPMASTTPTADWRPDALAQSSTIKRTRWPRVYFYNKLIQMMLATDSTAPRISNSWSAQCRNDGTSSISQVSQCYAVCSRGARHNTAIRLTETQIKTMR